FETASVDAIDQDVIQIAAIGKFGFEDFGSVNAAFDFEGSRPIVEKLNGITFLAVLAALHAFRSQHFDFTPESRLTRNVRAPHFVRSRATDSHGSDCESKSNGNPGREMNG